ncbi:hypothetical protein BVRB_3g069090 [Beta vulgaris subsp. vulgaris]|nr:hypothetical protein BVRB_3g069090 [Beta vulgaris subsp. vulgaris]
MIMTIATMGIVIVAKHMIIGIAIMRVGARDIRAVVLTSMEEAEVLLVGERFPIREGSKERRAKIEQWNREKEEAEQAAKT